MKKYTTEQQAANRAKWVAALRSGKYEQATQALHPAKKEFCCLGVACNISQLGHWVEGHEAYDYVIDDVPENAILPDEVANWLGVGISASLKHDYNVYDSLLEMNDKGISFGEIADVIEKGGIYLKSENVY